MNKCLAQIKLVELKTVEIGKSSWINSWTANGLIGQMGSWTKIYNFTLWNMFKIAKWMHVWKNVKHTWAIKAYMRQLLIGRGGGNPKRFKYNLKRLEIFSFIF